MRISSYIKPATRRFNLPLTTTTAISQSRNMSSENKKSDPLSKVDDATTASTTGPNMSTETDPAKMPKDALEAEPDAGEVNQGKEDAGMAALPTIT